MTATRVIDDHIELANIGTKTHAEIEGHIQGIGNYAFPAADGTANQILETNGSGALSFVNKPAGFACGSLNACNLSDIGTRPHSQITDVGVSDHHVKYTDAEVDAIVATHTGISDAHHSPYTDAEVDAIVATHTGISDAHHSPYTDAEAVAACDACDEFIERNEENLITNEVIFKRTSAGSIIKGKIIRNHMMFTGTLFRGWLESTNTPYLNLLGMMDVLVVDFKGTDTTKSSQIKIVKVPGAQDTAWYFNTIDAVGLSNTRMEIRYNKIDAKVNLFITSIKSGATQAGAGAAAKEVWKTNGHASLPDNVLLIGV